MEHSELSHTVTGLLRDWRAGDKEAANRLMELVYAELHQIASREMRREHGEHTLQTTALVFASAELRQSTGRIGRISSQWPQRNFVASSLTTPAG
jgi:hypothetical protein